MEELPSRFARIVEAIETLRISPQNQEYDLHALISSALSERSIHHEHEARIGAGCRVDFLIDRIAIEIKIGKPSSSALRKQLERYLMCDVLEGIIVVTERSTSLPHTIHGKRIVNISLNRLWGVSLP